MKNKQIILLAALLGISGAATAATSVTLYGRVDVGYEYKKVKNADGSFTQDTNSGSGGYSRYGIKGQEDLGNGLSATFQLEGAFEGDTGAITAGKTMFDRESNVGIKGNFGHIRLGRSISALEQATAFANTGRRFADIAVYKKLGSGTSVETRHSNALFYNYSHSSGFSFGADVTTKGGYKNDLTEGVSGTKAGYGVFAKYKGGGFEVGAGYQDDGVQKADTMRRQWAVAATYTYKPVTFGLSYSAGKDDVVNSATEAKLRHISAFVSGKLTKDDTLMAFYRHVKFERTTAAGVQTADEKTQRYGVEYVHALSKRTSIYADIVHQKSKDRGVNVDKNTFTGYNLAIRHNF